MLWTEKRRDDCIAEKWCRQQRRLSPIKRSSIVRLFPDRPIRRRFFLTRDSSHRQKRNLPQFILQPISLCDCKIDDKSVLAAYRHHIVIILTEISYGSNGFYVEIQHLIWKLFFPIFCSIFFCVNDIDTLMLSSTIVFCTFRWFYKITMWKNINESKRISILKLNYVLSLV